MAHISVPGPAAGQVHVPLTASIRRITRHSDPETMRLLVGILGILLAAAVVFGMTAPVH